MQFGLALAYPFRDAQWFRKVLGAAACLCIPILGVFPAAGWALEVCRNVVRGREGALPAVDLRRHAKDGLAVCGLFLMCAAPVILWLGAGAVVDVLLTAATVDSIAADVFWWVFEIAALALVAASGMWAVAAVGALAEGASVLRAAGIRGAAAAVRSAPAAYGLTVLSWLGLGLLAASGIAVCGAGMLFTSAFAAAAAFHLAGQARRSAAGKPMTAGLPADA